MDVVFGDSRHVVVHNKLNFRNIEASTRDIGGDKDFNLKTKTIKFVKFKILTWVG